MFWASIVLLALNSDSCGEKLKTALAALQQRNASQATSILEANRDECSETGIYSELLGAADELSGQPAAAEEAYRKAVTLDPQNARFRFELGAAYLENGKPQDAVQHLKLALSLDPSNAAGKKYLIAAYVASNAWQDASQVFETVGALDHPHLLKDPVMVLWLARVLIETKRADRIDHLIAPDDPQMTPPLLFSLGGLFADHQMYADVVRFLNRIPDRDADDAVYFNLGEAYSHLQEFQKAQACYFEAIDKRPGHVGAYFHVGLDYASGGQQRKSVPWLARAHQLAPDRSDIIFALAEQLINLEYFDTAAELLKNGPDGKPDDALLLVASGDLKAAEGQEAAAIQCYQDALAKMPRLVQALVGLAHVQIAQLKYPEARQSLELALSVAPDNSAAEGALGFLECKQDVWDSGTVHLEHAWKQDQANAQLGLELAKAYRRAGRLSDALRVLTPLHSRLQTLAAFHLELFQIYGQMHRTADSKVELDAFNALQKTGETSLRFENARTYVF